MATSLYAYYEKIDQILGTQAATCPLPCCGGGGFAAADVDVSAFEEHASKREARMRKRVGARGKDQR